MFPNDVPVDRCTCLYMYLEFTNCQANTPEINASYRARSSHDEYTVTACRRVRGSFDSREQSERANARTCNVVLAKGQHLPKLTGLVVAPCMAQSARSA
jgi:hypothetical protein